MSKVIVFHGDGPIKQWDHFPSMETFWKYEESLPEEIRDKCFVYLDKSDYWYDLSITALNHDLVPKKYRLLAVLLKGTQT